MLFFSLVPATFWAIVGYVVLFSSSKVDGGTRVFNRILAAWIFVIAGFVPIVGAYVKFAGLCPIGEMLNSLPAWNP